MVAPPKQVDSAALSALPSELPANRDCDEAVIADSFPSLPSASVRPADWPAEGPIDLSVHDLPHSSSATEWWYLNTHLRTADNRSISIFASFFRVIASQDEETKKNQHVHSLTWAISDNDAGKYFAESWVDRDAPRLGLEKVDRGEGAPDPRLRRAIREMLVKGSVPYPDRVMEQDAIVGTQRLSLEFQEASLYKEDDGCYRLHLYHDHHKVGCDLVFRPLVAPLRHGENGIVKAPDGGDMFYYFIPHCEVEGSLLLNGSSIPVEQGTGWYDHEFGGHRFENLLDQKIAWNWTSLQLDDGRQITAYTLYEAEDLSALDQKTILIDKDGNATRHDDVEIHPLNVWRSTRTFNTYPTRWRLEVPSAELFLTLEASFDDQEFISLVSKPAFWEGRVNAHGTLCGEPIQARGYVERSGFKTLDTLEDFFEAVGKETRKSIQQVIPYKPSYEQVRDLVASEEQDDYMTGVHLETFVQTLIAPVREIADRGGKCWRSYAALACCDAVGGDSRDYVQWLAMPELMHVGSLIVDDVQDRSEIRRGGPACHTLFGEALAINAGTAAYFMGHKLLQSDKLSQKNQLRIYDLYFQALRAGHTGQAMDLAGAYDLLPRLIETGDATEMADRILAIHRLKTGVPAGCLARMGAIAGDAREEQIDGLGRFFESVGLAFQIIDDVLNVRGFEDELKSRGEDIAAGKITAPILTAFSCLDQKERAWLGRTLLNKPTDPETIATVSALLEDCGAIDRCTRDADEIVERAWTKLDPLLEDSIPKMMLRAFGWFVLERHY